MPTLAFPGFLRRSLRAKVTLGVVLPLVLILGTFTAIEYRRHRARVIAHLSLLASHSGYLVQQELVHELLESDFAAVQALLDSLGASEQFRIVQLLDPSGRVLFASDGESPGVLLDNLGPDCQPCHRLPAEARPASVIVTNDGGERVLRSMLPIGNPAACARCHDPEQRLLGLVLLDIPMAPLEAPLTGALREKLLWCAGMIVVTVLITNLTMSRLVVRRVQRIARTLADLGEGRHSPLLPADSPDEIGSLAVSFNEMRRSIESKEADKETLSAELRRHAVRAHELLRLLITAQEEERRRVARELHDELGQGLAALALRLEALERTCVDQPELVRPQLQDLRRQIADTTSRTYDMILALRPSALDDLGLVPALRADAGRALQGTGIAFDLDARELRGRLPPEIETALFRAFQEALSNVVRHSGATRVRVSIALSDSAIEGRLEDDGRGFDVDSIDTAGNGARGLGLLGMRERVAHCGGTLEVRSRPGVGTTLRIRIPLPETHSV